MTALPALHAPATTTSAVRPRAHLAREGLLLAPFLLLIGITFFLAQTDPDY